MPEIFASRQAKVSLLDLSKKSKRRLIMTNVAKKLGLLSLFVHTLEHVIRIYTNLTRKESECGAVSRSTATRPALPAKMSRPGL